MLASWLALPLIWGAIYRLPVFIDLFARLVLVVFVLVAGGWYPDSGSTTWPMSEANWAISYPSFVAKSISYISFLFVVDRTDLSHLWATFGISLLERLEFNCHQDTVSYPYGLHQGEKGFMDRDAFNPHERPLPGSYYVRLLGQMHRKWTPSCCATSLAKRRENAFPNFLK